MWHVFDANREMMTFFHTSVTFDILYTFLQPQLKKTTHTHISSHTEYFFSSWDLSKNGEKNIFALDKSAVIFLFHHWRQKMEII